MEISAEEEHKRDCYARWLLTQPLVSRRYILRRMTTHHSEELTADMKERIMTQWKSQKREENKKCTTG